jgi:YHS domain-containing protein
MNLFLRSIATGTIALAVAGCAGEEPSTGTTANQPVAAPPKSPNAPDAGSQAHMAAETQPAGTTAAATAKPKEEPGSAGGPKVEGPTVENEKTAAGDTTLSAEQIAKIKELPADEQQAAIAQASCPVSGEPLGSMGKPFKVSAEGRSFYLCCKGCEKEVKADPKGVLAKLDAKRR